MTIYPFSAELALEHRRDLMHQADEERRAGRALVARPRRAGWLDLRIRALRPDDGALLTDIFDRLSPASRAARFLHAKSRLTAAELRYLVDVDHHDHEALVALTRWGGRPVGVARFIRGREDPSSADVAAAVVDEWQERGVGSMLVDRLATRALSENISSFTALSEATNVRARRLLGKLGEVTVLDREAGTIS